MSKEWKNWEEEWLEIVAGLPLAIVTLGGVLVTKPSLIVWEKVYEYSLLSLNKGEGLGEGYQRELLDVLVSSYHNLPPQLKPCMLSIFR